MVGESLKLCGGEKALDVHRPEISTCRGREQPTGDAWLLGKTRRTRCGTLIILQSALYLNCVCVPGHPPCTVLMTVQRLEGNGVATLDLGGDVGALAGLVIPCNPET